MIEFKTIDDVLEFAINNEQRAYDFYMKLAETVTSSSQKETFISFANEEKIHKEKLLAIKANKNFGFEPEKIADLKISDYIVNVKASDDMTYQEALSLAIQREKAAFKLYNSLAKLITDNEISDLFYALAQEEAKHKLNFEVEYDDVILKDN